jgi:hypothetical protein
MSTKGITVVKELRLKMFSSTSGMYIKRYFFKEEIFSGVDEYTVYNVLNYQAL